MNSLGTACFAVLCLFAIVSTGNGFPQESADQVQYFANTLCKFKFKLKISLKLTQLLHQSTNSPSNRTKPPRRISA